MSKRINPEATRLIRRAYALEDAVMADFPELRFFPTMVNDVCAAMYHNLRDLGLEQCDAPEIMEAVAGRISVAGSVYCFLNDRAVGVDEAALESGVIG